MNENVDVKRERKTTGVTVDPGSKGYSSAERREELLEELTHASNEEVIAESDIKEVYKNASTGKESVEILRGFSQNKGFKTLLLRQYKEYAALCRELEMYANKQGYEPQQTSVFAKGMMYITTAVNTLKDKSDSKLAEIMIQGINMGIVATTRQLNNLSEQNRTCSYAEELLRILQKNLEEMKLFL